MYESLKSPVEEWCESDCPHLGKIIGNNGRKLWCFDYGREIAERDETEENYLKCEECLNNTKALRSSRKYPTEGR